MKLPFAEYPPIAYLLQVLEHCPKAGATYLQLWQQRDKDSRVSIKRADVRITFLTSLAKFRHDILLLVKEQLVSVHETPTMIKIELVDWHDDA